VELGNGAYCFENYVVGGANRLAVAAARAVAQSLGSAYNPLFIYSQSGLGKTHLVLAVAHEAQTLRPGLTVQYSPIDDFVEELHQAISSGRMDAFKERYGSLDALLLDDIQFLAGRQETQSELLRLFNALQRSGKQIVLTSDRPPSEIADLDQRLITRFSGGLVVDIGPPDYETRVAILRKKAEERNAQLEQGVIEAVAQLRFTNVRELSGALNRLIACQTLGETRVTPNNVQQLLGDVPQPELVPVAAPQGAEFGKFLSDLSHVVAEAVDGWRARLATAAAHWRSLGFATEGLDRLTGTKSKADIDAVLSEYERAVTRLRELEADAIQLDPQLAGAAFFRDPERLAEAEAQVSALFEASAPLTGPRHELRRAGFEVGPSNQLAVHAADSVIGAPAVTYNPLFIHGPPGVGKTHLLHAIGNALAERSGAVACLSADAFVDELIAALQQNTLERWRARYRKAQALLLDDVQRCAGKERTQEELFHVFNVLSSAGKQIVITADRAPKALSELEPRLRSRFEGGLVVEIQPPDHALRTTLYTRQLAAAGVRAGESLVTYLAARAAASIEEIGGTVQRLVRAAAVVGVPLTASFARKELEGLTAAPTPVASATLRVDDFFLDREKVVWEWPDVAGRLIEEFR